MRAPRKTGNCPLHLTNCVLFLVCFISGVIWPRLLHSASIGRDPGNLRFTGFELVEDLTNNTINCQIQDSYGFMWIGTEDGINRYDGNSLHHFKHDASLPYSVVDNNILGLFEDRYKQLWIGTQQGVSRYIQETDSFKNYMLDESDINSNILNAVNEFAEDSLGHLYTATEGGFVYQYNRAADKFEKINSTPFGNVKCLLIAPDDIMWLGSEKAISRFSTAQREAGHYVLETPDADKSRSNYIMDICYDSRNNKIWIGTIQTGLYYLDLGTGKIHPSDIIERRQETVVNTMLIDEDEYLWMTTNFGLYIHDLRSGETYQYGNDEDDPAAIKAIGLQNIFIDQQGNVWADTYVSYSGKAFYHYTPTARQPSNLDASDVTALLVDSKNRMWVGYYSEGVDVLNLNTNEKMSLRSVRDDDTTIGYGTVFTLFEDSKGNIWAGTYTGGLQKYNELTHTFKTYGHDQNNPDSIGGNDIRRIDEDRLGNLYVITHNQGFSVMDVKTETFRHYRHDPFFPKTTLLDNWPFTILVDSTDTVWIGTPVGISKLNEDKVTFTNYQHDTNDPHSLSNPLVSVLFEDSEGTLWAGTRDGLNKLNSETNNFTIFRQRDGLPNNNIVGILEDDNKNLWISTLNGISCYSLKEGTFRNFDDSDGLHHKEFKVNSASSSVDGRLFFGGVGGITSFDPKEIRDNTYVPPVVITDFKLFNQSVPIEPDNPDAILKKSIFLTDTIRLPYDKNVITFNFTALNYIQSERNQHAYVMDGFDEDWVYAGDRKEATYTNLDPGTYYFRVRGSNNDGYWNEEGTSIKLIISPPLWKGPGFQVVAGFILAGLIVLGYYLRVRSLRKRQQNLEQTVDQRTQEMQHAYDNLAKANKLLEEQKEQIREQNEKLTIRRETLESAVRERTTELEIAVAKAKESDRLKSSFLANMSHEIRTPMNAIIGFLQIMNRQNLSEEKWQHCMEIIQRSSDTLLRLIDDILDLSRIEAREIEIDPEPSNLHELLEDVYEYFLEVTIKTEKPTVDLKLVTDEMEVDDPEFLDLEGFAPMIIIDPVRLKQILSNLLSNAIKFTDEGTVTFGYRFEHNSENATANIVFFVKDTGIGIPPNQLDFIFERFYKIESDTNRLYPGAGLGLTITRKLVELMGGNIFISSKIRVGTTVEVVMPLIFADSDMPMELPEPDLDDFFTYPDWREKTILIAEDELPNFEYIEAILSPTEANILHAADGYQAIRCFKENKIDIALMDIKMPGMNGVDAISGIREFDKITPIVVQSAHTEVTNKEASKAAGAQGYIVKPYTPDQIIEKLNEFLKG